MTVKPPPPAPPSRPLRPAAPPAQTKQPQSVRSLSITRGRNIGPQKIVLYGPGGVGKTELASLVSEVGVEPVFIDLENGTRFQDVARLQPETFEEARAAVRQAADSDFGALVIDSLTKAEEMAAMHVLATILVKSKPEDAGRVAESIEDYGWGKGYTHVYEQFIALLQDLDAAHRRGKHIIAIAHECTANVPNPSGEDFMRYEPRLQSPPSGKSSIRYRVKEWCDHLIFLDFDLFVEKNGKAKGGGTRSIYPAPAATHLAKTRELTDSISYPQGDATLWRTLFQ